MEPLSPTLVKKLVGAGYVLHKPISKQALAKLVEATGSLPGGVMSFLATSDGLGHFEPTCEVSGSKAMLGAYPYPCTSSSR